MIERLRCDWLAWLLTLGALAALIGPLSLLREIGQPYGGYITFQRATAPHNEIDVNTPIWWSGLINHRAQHGDRLVAVDGRPHATQARAAYDAATADGQTSVVLQVIRGDNAQPRNILVPIDTFGWANFFDARMPDLVIGFALWLGALIVYLARPEEPANRAFAIAAAIIGYGRVLYVHSLFFDTPYATAVELLLACTLAFVGPSIVYFTVYFPRRASPSWGRPFITAIFLLGLFSATAAVLSRLPALSLPIRAAAEWSGYYLSIAMLFVGLGAVFFRLVRMLLRSGTSPRERRIAIILLAGFVLATPAVFASGLNALTLGERQPFYFWLGLDLRYLLLFVPLAFAFVLVRYHAMRAPSRLFIFLIVLTSSALIAALSAWAWTRVHPTWPDNGLRPPFLALFSVALLSSILWSTAARWRSLLGRNLDWDQYSNASLRAFGRRITASVGEDQVPQTMVESLVTDFGLEQAAIWLRSSNEPVLHLAAQGGELTANLPETISFAEPLDTLETAPLRAGEMPTSTTAWAAQLVEIESLAVIVPLVSDGVLLGAMGLGQRWDEEIYDDRDLETAELVGQQAVLFLLAARYIQELKRVPGQMADAQERERLRMANELHDTVQQLLGRLPFYLAVSRNSMMTDPDQATELLDQAIADVAEAAQAVRQIRHNLAPNQLERGLGQPLITLTTNFQRRTGLETTLIIPPELDAATDLKTRHALYRVIEQALNNAATHAEATHVAIQLAVEEARVTCSITDDGHGSTPEERRQAHAQGSYGIESMSARLMSSGGGLTIESAPGQGLVVRGWVPVVVDDQGAAAGTSDTGKTAISLASEFTPFASPAAGQ